MMSSEVGLTEHHDFGSQKSNSERMVPYKLLNYEKLEVRDILGVYASNESSGEYHSINSDSPHV